MTTSCREVRKISRSMWRTDVEDATNDQFRRYMTDTPFADIRNGSSGGRAGSSNGAAAFLEFFVPTRNYEEGAEKLPWVHLDIAGTAWGPGSKAGTERENPSSNTEPRESMLEPCITLSLKP